MSDAVCTEVAGSSAAEVEACLVRASRPLCCCAGLIRAVNTARLGQNAWRTSKDTAQRDRGKAIIVRLQSTLKGYGTNLVDLDVRAPQPPGPAQPAHPGRATLAALPEVVQLAPLR